MPDLDGSLFGKEQLCFGCGPAHPAGFRLQFREEEGAVTTRFTPDQRYQGAPGIMHGGLVFTLADELAAWLLIARSSKFGFTARFAGKFTAPARLGLEIVGRAEFVRGTSRTAEIEVTLAQGPAKVFGGTFTFVLLDKGGAEELLGQALPAEWERFAR